MKHLFNVLILLLVSNCIDAQNVGIGTTNPLQKLHVEGNLYVKDSVGIGVPNPAYPLSFASVYGEKIALWTGGPANYTHGFAVLPSVLRIHTDTGTSDMVFGSGSDPIFVEHVRIQGSGNVGIGNPNPAYRLDVLHGGSNGIRSRSANGFSAIDIDAFDGDAALRFYKSGDGRWNIRNSPFTDNLEFFELGGGGTRMVIEDSTGDIGMGTSDPEYKLDIRHFGGTGIRNYSTSSFAVIDIDAFDGDAALRFAKNGTRQWNIRNRPADNYFEIFELGGGGSRFVVQDGTGNVGIGETTNPTYRLDVLHGGSTGIRSRSTAGFSVVDVDAANGDAGLRLIRSGVAQWNIHNRPADNFFEIFKTSSPFAGARLVIKNDSSGNVGIGETINPTYKLDVLHAGLWGMRVRSASSFSSIDIDGFSGDAALRFVKNGVNQWNIRNDPANDNLQFFEMGGGGERMRIENGTGIVRVIGTLAKGAGSFQIDHPLDPENKYLYHSFVESPDMKNIYDGNIITDASGKAVVELPDYFEALNKDYRYQLTVIGSFAQAIISKKVENNRFEISTSAPNVEVSWMVTGIRQDAYANKNRIPNSVNKEPENKGRYLHPAAFNQPVTKGIGYPAEGEKSSLTSVVGQPAPQQADGISGSNAPLPVAKPNTEINSQKQNNTIQSVTDVPLPAPKNKTAKTTGKSSTD